MINKSNPQITIIIPQYNNRKLLNNLLNSLNKIKTPHNTIIVDNASIDDSVKFIKTNFPDITLIENKTNKGFAYAVNQGIKASKTKYVFLLNNDTIVTEKCLDNLLKTIEHDSKIFSVSSKMIQYHNPDYIDDAGDEYNILGWSKKIGFNHEISKYSEDCEVFSACAGAALYKRDLFDKIGFFDDNFESYVEDMDLSFRSRLHGYKSYYSAGAHVYHYGSATSGSKHNPFKVKLSARNNIYLIYKNWSLWMKIINSPFIFIGILIKYIFFSKKGYGTYYLDGIHEGIKTRKKLSRTSDISFYNYLKIEFLMIKNVFKYPF
ncbi:glycosyltransferase family 2 protein [Methanosphaera sp. WGK6]|uniref:glycosyltransferase family 2 protein n=1 Tax=Methanosphaera sp. WGK6 TaxID=1561964 RepID=UPI00084C1AFB|nr:glycosyltransferase family 2 protein [Methanosphaera sp. WGK6]OED30273.1 glycosyl transferase family 2 [Methanosphaera sp. WGK6]